MLFRKLFLLTAFICIFAAVSAFSADKKVTITFWHIDTQDELKSVWQNIADKYMALHPNVKIEVTILENEAFKQKISTVMQSGNPPDIFRSWGGGVMNQYADAGLLKDITKDLNSPWGNTIAKGPLSVYSYKGKVYGIPFNMGGVGIWYNKEIFNKLGIKPFTTWKELLAGVKKIKAAGITPIALAGGDKWPGHYWWAYLAAKIGGKEAFDLAASRKGSFADPTFVQAGERLKELVDLQPFQTGFLSTTYNDEAALVGSGKAAMELMGQWAPVVQALNTVDKKGLGDKLGFMPFPSVEGGKGKLTDVMGGGDGWVVGKNAPPEAVDFLKFMFQMENYQTIIKPFGLVPTVKGAEKFVTDPNVITVSNAVAKAGYYQLYYDQYLPPAVGETIKDATQGIFAGTITPVDAAKMIEKSMAENSN